MPDWLTQLAETGRLTAELAVVASGLGLAGWKVFRNTRKMLDSQAETKETLEKILVQTTATNGRVSSLEARMSHVEGAVEVLSRSKEFGT